MKQIITIILFQLSFLYCDAQAPAVMLGCKLKLIAELLKNKEEEVSFIEGATTVLTFKAQENSKMIYLINGDGICYMNVFVPGNASIKIKTIASLNEHYKTVKTNKEWATTSGNKRVGVELSHNSYYGECFMYMIDIN